MSNPIGFNQLFNKGDFQSGLDELKRLIGAVKEEITLAEKAAKDFSTTMGGNLKAQVASLSSTNANLDGELKKVRADFDALKQSVATTTTTLNQYKVVNDKLGTQVTELEKKLKDQTTTQDKLSNTTKKSTINFGQLSQAMIGVASGAELIYNGIVTLKEQFVLALQSTMEFETSMK